MSKDRSQPHLSAAPQSHKPLYRDYTHKLAAAEALYWNARELKAAYFKAVHPDISDAEIDLRVKRWMMYASS